MKNPTQSTTPQPEDSNEINPYESRKLWEATHKPPTVLVELSDEAKHRYIEGYKADVTFRGHWEKELDEPESWDPANLGE